MLIHIHKCAKNTTKNFCCNFYINNRRDSMPIHQDINKLWTVHFGFREYSIIKSQNCKIIEA